MKFLLQTGTKKTILQQGSTLVLSGQAKAIPTRNGYGFEKGCQGFCRFYKGASALLLGHFATRGNARTKIG